MLTKEELRTYEKTVGFNLWQVEKDYLQHLVLLFLYSRIKNEPVFKGGTALQKVFGLNRFSIDLDFSSTKNNSEKVFEKVVEE
jgi:predicted nucleotidyltransferase component of viral defense system